MIHNLCFTLFFPPMNNTFPKITDTLKGWIQRGKRGIIAKNQEANSQFFYRNRNTIFCTGKFKCWSQQPQQIHSILLCGQPEKNRHYFGINCFQGLLAINFNLFKPKGSYVACYTCWILNFTDYQLCLYYCPLPPWNTATRTGRQEGET